MATIVLVDDDALVIRALARTLRAGGHVLYTFEAPEQALAELEAIAPDMVISDQRMPGMSGVDLLNLVRARRPHAVRVICSGVGQVGAAAGGLIDGYLAKPWVGAEVLGAVAGLLDLRRAA